MKILPCPFCGKTPTIKYNSGSYGYTPPSFSIRCYDCGCGFSEPTQKWEQGVGHFSVIDEAEKSVRERWNTRS